MLAVGKRFLKRADDREIQAAVGERQRVLRAQRDRLVEVLDRALILAEPVKHAAAIGEGDRGRRLQPYHLAVIRDGVAELAQRDMGVAAVEERGGETVVVLLASRDHGGAGFYLRLGALTVEPRAGPQQLVARLGAGARCRQHSQ